MIHGRDSSNQPVPLSLADFIRPQDHFEHTEPLFDWDDFRTTMDDAKEYFALIRRSEAIDVYIENGRK